MNKLISIALILASMYYLLSMATAGQHHKFDLAEAFKFFMQAAYYLLAGYAALRLLLIIGKD